MLFVSFQTDAAEGTPRETIASTGVHPRSLLLGVLPPFLTLSWFLLIVGDTLP